MLNPFSDFQLISYAVDGEIRLWDIQDLGCVKVIRIEGSIGLLNVVAHPTEPNILFAVIITKKEAGWFLFLILTSQTQSIGSWSSTISRSLLLSVSSPPAQTQSTA